MFGAEATAPNGCRKGALAGHLRGGARRECRNRAEGFFSALPDAHSRGEGTFGGALV